MNRLSLWRDRLQLGLSLAGVGIAGYLTYVKFFGIDPYCAGIGNCEAVQTSPYAELFGIPVAVYGLATYLGLIALWWIKYSAWRDLGYLATKAFFFVTMVGVLFSAYLTYLELFVILEICPWCVASAIVMVLLFLLSANEALASDDEFEEPASELLPKSVQVRSQK